VALIEVVMNAREAIDKSGVIRVAARVRELDSAQALEFVGTPPRGEYLELAIADSGVGFTAEAKRRVLSDPFFTTKPRHRGLGLAAAYGILSAHYGGIQIVDGPKGGTEVRLLFPVSRQAATVAKPRSAKGPTAGERILVVDDDLMVLQVVCATLERAGYRVQPMSNGADALAEYDTDSDDPFGLVLSDVIMPRMSGVELARQLLRKDPEANLLFMSGQISPDFAQANLAGWRFDVLSKPFRPDGLLRAVRAALDRSATCAPAAAQGAGLDRPEPSTP
jgi:CheY-like chemotaxis protein